MDPTDADRLILLDRIAERMPELDLHEREIDWMTYPEPDGAEALLVDGGGMDGGDGVAISNAGKDLHVTGSLRPLAPVVGCIVIRARRHPHPRPLRA